MVFLLAVAALVAGCGGSTGSPLPASSEPRPTAETPAPELYDVGGFALWMHCEGDGSPTVVFDAGLSTSSTAWDSVAPGVADRTRTCVYDRAGVGNSEPRPAGSPQATAGSMAKELSALLAAAGERGPYVVVGHSYGGMVAQLFADQSGSDVAGVVLVDSASAPELLNPTWIRWFGPDFMRWDDGPARVDLRASKKELQSVSGLNAPLIVLTQNYRGDDSATKAFRRSWDSMQARLAAWSDDSVHVVAADSGHFIPEDAPGLIVASVDEVLTAVRSGDPLLPCSARFASVDGRCV
jgi:pimeloyl-ACP methyl ester carboxylesterase